ncbi:MAG: hypothetical protein PF482_12045, partial [Desulfobacteraceae bacterium]|nr:hypothetical protein [Desulfobacteraceae bacterium]
NVLWENYDEIVRQYAADMTPPVEILDREGVYSSNHKMIPEVLNKLKNNRNSGLDAETMLKNLEKVRNHGVSKKNS